MRTNMIIRYRVRDTGAAEENQRLVEEVFAQLEAERPDGLRYATFRLADGTSFVHVVEQDGEDDPLTRLEAFERFQEGLADRLAGAPELSEATVVGSYRLLGRDG
jgi:hypothetical protein